MLHISHFNHSVRGLIISLVYINVSAEECVGRNTEVVMNGKKISFQTVILTFSF